MKKFWKEFLLRGLLCATGGPLVIAVVYGILGATGTVTSLSPKEVCTAIISVTLLAFIAAGMSAIYQTERLPLPIMILLHGGVLYVAYILTYLVNGWLLNKLVPILVFTAIFLVGYGIIWMIIYLVNKANAERMTKLLKQ
ncbi:MAG: DUF3021 domain-containing protein [Oscillospiraceae bacterium]|nr:DUF3021 domain-containing protein [Oscillospiraceae bacterium]